MTASYLRRGRGWRSRGTPCGHPLAWDPPPTARSGRNLHIPHPPAVGGGVIRTYMPTSGKEDAMCDLSCRIVPILMRRDGLTREEAEDLVNETRSAVFEAFEEGLDAEQVFMDYLGLELDYILDILW